MVFVACEGDGSFLVGGYPHRIVKAVLAQANKAFVIEVVLLL